MTDLRRVSEVEWLLEATEGMRVPGRVYASEALMDVVKEDQSVTQVANVAHLPGIVGASMAMPDIHLGYGFPIGGVAATSVADGGVVSPGGVGFDICCGVRLLASTFTATDWQEKGPAVMARLDERIPRGAGKGAVAPGRMVRDVLSRGAAAALDAGYGWDDDLMRCEESGTSEGGDPGAISEKALTRGQGQLGSLGGGNHFLEVQVVEDVIEDEAAAAFGLSVGMVVVMLHCGSRGLGHQTCTDHLRRMEPAMRRHDISVPDRQLACVPVDSPEGRDYLAGLAASANYAWANRHILAHVAREAFAESFGTTPEGTEMDLVYDVAHNLAKLESHPTAAGTTELCVHRKGATRALAPGHGDLPAGLETVGQPILIPGSMGTASWVLAGVEGNPAFASAAHGAGRLMSRRRAKQRSSGRDVRSELETVGVAVRPGSVSLLSEEAPYAYKDVDEVVNVCERAGLAKRVARLRPLGVVKG